MKTLLAFCLSYLEFLYSDPRYRFTDSKSSGHSDSNAYLALTGPVATWAISNDRGRIGISAAPTKLATNADNWYRLGVIRAYLDEFDETTSVTPTENAAWLGANLNRVESLFTDSNLQQSCSELLSLERSLADKYWGKP